MKFYFGTPGWGWTMWGFGYKAHWFIGLSVKRENPMTTQIVAVLAGTRAQFTEWQREHPDTRAVFCDYWPGFAGIEFTSMVEIGTFRKRPDALEIWQQVAPRVRPNA